MPALVPVPVLGAGMVAPGGPKQHPLRSTPRTPVSKHRRRLAPLRRPGNQPAFARPGRRRRMIVNPVYLLMEVGAGTFFVIASWLALRRGKLPFLELISAAIFGLLLEQANQAIFETYEYSTQF